MSYRSVEPIPLTPAMRAAFRRRGVVEYANALEGRSRKRYVQVFKMADGTLRAADSRVVAEVVRELSKRSNPRVSGSPRARARGEPDKGRRAPRRARARAQKPVGHVYRCVLERGSKRAVVTFRSRDDTGAKRYARGLLAHKYKARPVSLKRTSGAGRRKNPTASAELDRAAAALEDFTGAERVKVSRRRPPKNARAGWELGDVASISYIATRDGETSEFVHEFKRRSRPQLVSTADGSQLYLLGGAYSITDRGIVDR